MTRPPAQALALILAVAHEEGEPGQWLLDPNNVSSRRERAIRHKVWHRLRQESDGEHRTYSDAEIASWFGVRRATVTIGNRQPPPKVKRARPRPRKSVGVTPNLRLPANGR